jgi:L-aspartate oxidase
MREKHPTDVLVIGAGIGGCITALTAAENGCRVILVTRARNNEDSSTILAQGGIVYKGNRDSINSLIDDIETAGDGMCSEEAVRHIAREGAKLVKELLIDTLAVPFDRNKRGRLNFTREGAHSVPRIIHCADATGKYIAEALWQAVKAHREITIYERTTAIDLLTTSHHSQNPQDIYRPVECVGAYVLKTRPHTIIEIYAKQTVLATGGLGQVYLYTTNNTCARGDGYAMALRAGAMLVNMEYVQFHPTSLYDQNANNFLITEAMRGEGAELRDAKGKKFARKYHPLGSLAPRDIVSRAIHVEMLSQHRQCMYLDITHRPAEWIKTRFPTIYDVCREHNIDITQSPIPIVPAAHYACGGILVDSNGNTTIPRLRAVGEVSCTGIHGANRLASTSLLEAVVWGVWAGRDIARAVHERKTFYFPVVARWREEKEYVDPALLEQDWMIIKHTMWNYVGLIRGDRRLRRAQRVLRELQTEVETFYQRAAMTDQIIGLRNGLQTARAVLYAALRNQHSRGCHYREQQA